MDLSQEDFESMRTIIKDRSGIFLGDTKINFLGSKLSQRMKETDSESVKDYYYYLKYDGKGSAELDILIESVAIGETFFFRHIEQLADFSERVAPEIVDRRKMASNVSIWSAGCSTGEEAYTLAILLLESDSKIQPSAINILASDINASALQSAREGIYDNYSVRNVPSALLEKYFDRKAKDRFMLKPEIKSLVRFASINLMDYRSTGRVRSMDCIFCRNVMIYFDDRDKSRCAEHLYESMSADGYLFLGYSESLGRISNLFEPMKLKETIVYRKAGHRVE